MTVKIVNETKRPNNLPFNAAYRDGHSTRRDGKQKLMPPIYHGSVNRYWWLAGWNDADIELCARTT